MTRAGGWPALPVGVLLALAASGCSAANTPLLRGVDPIEVCAAVASERSIVVGEVISAPPGGDIVILDVWLDDAIGVAVSEAFLLPVANPTIGVAEYPPEDFDQWHQRIDPHDVNLSAASETNVVLVVERLPVAESSADSLAIRFRYRGQEYVENGNIAYEFKDACS